MTNGSTHPPSPEHLKVMEKQLTYIIQTAPEKSYLALMIKPYIETVQCDSLRMLYTYLNGSQDSTRFLPEAIRHVMIDCKLNERLRGVIQEMIQRLYV